MDSYQAYSWHQSHDQATILLMVPYNSTEEDMMVVIEKNYLIAGVQGLPPIIKGRLYGNIDPTSSSWQLESQSNNRGRTTSTTSIASTHSSYAILSDPEIYSNFTPSMESAPVSDTEDFSSPPLSPPVDDTFANNGYMRSRAASHTASPGRRSTLRSVTSSFSSLDSLRSGRLLTLHLEKDGSIIWPSLIIGPCPEVLSPYVHNSVIFDASHELEHQYNMDPTSLVLLAMELEDIRKDREEAFECFLRAWHIAHVPKATMKLTSHYLPLPLTLDVSKYQTEEQAPRGSTTYYYQCIGGRKGLAQLYLEAGLLHLDGAATALLASGHSSLSSLRLPSQHEASIDVWKRDREAAAKFFDRAHMLNPELDIPPIPPSADELEIPYIDLQQPDGLKRRRKKGDKEETSALIPKCVDDDMENAWYVYLPGLVGAGTALVIVGVIGVLSFSSWSRRNQGS